MFPIHCNCNEIAVFRVSNCSLRNKVIQVWNDIMSKWQNFHLWVSFSYSWLASHQVTICSEPDLKLKQDIPRKKIETLRHRVSTCFLCCCAAVGSLACLETVLWCILSLMFSLSGSLVVLLAHTAEKDGNLWRIPEQLLMIMSLQQAPHREWRVYMCARVWKRTLEMFSVGIWLYCYSPYFSLSSSSFIISLSLCTDLSLGEAWGYTLKT